MNHLLKMICLRVHLKEANHRFLTYRGQRYYNPYCFDVGGDRMRRTVMASRPFSMSFDGSFWIILRTILKTFGKLFGPILGNVWIHFGTLFGSL